MKNRLTNNFGLKLMAVLFSIILWMIAVDINNPVEKTVFSGVQVQLVNTGSITGQGKTYKVLNNTDKVKITVRAPKKVLSQISRSDIVAKADLSKLSYTNTVPIELEVDRYVDGLVESIQTDKDILQLEIEDLVKKQLKIEVVQHGTLPEGYVAGKSSTESNTMSISGPASAVAPISRAVVEVTMDGSTSDISMVAAIRLLDEEGEEVSSSDVKKSIESVTVTVPILPTKEVPVVCPTGGQPKEGYVQVGNATADHSSIRIAGRASALQEVESIEIPETELNISDATNTLTKEVDIRRYLPADVSLAEDGFNGIVTVTVDIQPIRNKEIAVEAGKIQILNIPENWLAEAVADQELLLQLSGLQGNLDSVTEESIVPHIDLSALQDEEGNLPLGEVEAEVKFLLPDNVVQKETVTARLYLSQMTGEE